VYPRYGKIHTLEGEIYGGGGKIPPGGLTSDNIIVVGS